MGAFARRLQKAPSLADGGLSLWDRRHPFHRGDHEVGLAVVRWSSTVRDFVWREHDQGKEKVVQIVGLILIGLVIGALARLVLPGRQRIGILLTLLLGIGGALVGGIVASALGTGDIFELNVLGTIVGVIAAAGLIGAADAAGLGSGGRRDALPRKRR